VGSPRRKRPPPRATRSSALRAAVEEELITQNPANATKLPRGRQARIEPWEPEEFAQFLTSTEKERLQPLFVVAAFSRVRRGELCGLRWDDLDSDTGLVVVRRQRVSLSYKVRVRETKTDEGQGRRVYLPPVALTVLKAWRQRQRKDRLAWGPA
jgi:integrase